jgi:hypothetical protein
LSWPCKVLRASVETFSELRFLPLDSKRLQPGVLAFAKHLRFKCTHVIPQLRQTLSTIFLNITPDFAPAFHPPISGQTPRFGLKTAHTYFCGLTLTRPIPSNICGALTASVCERWVLQGRSCFRKCYLEGPFSQTRQARHIAGSIVQGERARAQCGMPLHKIWLDLYQENLDCPCHYDTDYLLPEWVSSALRDGRTPT